MTLQSAHGSLPDPDRCSLLISGIKSIRSEDIFTVTLFKGVRTQQLVFSNAETLTISKLVTLSHLLRDLMDQRQTESKLMTKFPSQKTFPASRDLF